MIALLIAVLCSTACARGKQPMAFAKLPQAIQDAVLAHFTADQVQLATCEKTMPKHYEYELRIADGTKLEYNQNAQLVEISNKAGIQTAFVPEKVLTYITETFPNSVITEYKVSPLKQAVELNDDIELVFDKHGKFLRIDD